MAASRAAHIPSPSKQTLLLIGFGFAVRRHCNRSYGNACAQFHVACLPRYVKRLEEMLDKLQSELSRERDKVEVVRVN